MWRIRPTKSWVVLVSVGFISLLGFSISARSAVWDFPDANCSVTTPDDWQTVASPNPKIRIAVASAVGNRGFSLGVETAPGGVDYVSNEFIQHLKRTIAARGGMVLSEHQFELERLPAVEIVFRVEQLPVPLVMVNQFVIANGSLYTLSASGLSGDAEADTVLQNSLASFRFLKKPTPNPFPGRSRAFAIGYYLGYWFFPVVIIGGLAFGLYFVLRPRKHRHRSRRMR